MKLPVATHIPIEKCYSISECVTYVTNTYPQDGYFDAEAFREWVESKGINNKITVSSMGLCGSVVYIHEDEKFIYSEFEHVFNTLILVFGHGEQGKRYVPFWVFGD